MPEGFARLGSSFLEPFANPQSRTHWVGLLVFFVVVAALSVRKKTGVSAFQKLRGDLRHQSSILDVQLFMGQQLLRLLVGVPTIASGWWIATRGVRWADATWGPPPALGLPDAAVVALYSLTLFVVWDLSRFLVHLAMHRIPALLPMIR